MAEILKEGSVVTVKPARDITAQNSADLRQKLRQVYEEGATRIIIDLEGVGIIDSIGLGLLAATHNSLLKRESKLELINADDNICSVLNLMRLDQHFIISCANQ
ncbi:STAS domain-containing protein [bacterium]|nr:STAS domain-containing protein [bacterium]